MNATIHADLLNLLRCPDSGERLEPASNEVLNRIEQRTGMRPEAALVSAGGRTAYLVVSGIPHLRPEDAISL